MSAVGHHTWLYGVLGISPWRSTEEHPQPLAVFIIAEDRCAGSGLCLFKHVLFNLYNILRMLNCIPTNT